MAREETWRKARYFQPISGDNWGDPYKIDDDLVLALDDFRHYIGCPIIITRGVAISGHSEGSYHYLSKGGCAADLIVVGYKKGPINLVMDAGRFGFRGIGYYPHWEYLGQTTGGLHVDFRPLKWDADETINYRYNRWIGIPKGDRSKDLDYLPMNMENLIKYGRLYGHIEGDLIVPG